MWTFSIQKTHITLHSSFWSFIGFLAKLMYQNKSACSKFNPVKSSRSWITTLSKKWVSAQIQIKEHSHFRWQCAEAWKRSLTWIWVNSNQSSLSKQYGHEWEEIPKRHAESLQTHCRAFDSIFLTGGRLNHCFRTCSPLQTHCRAFDSIFFNRR